MDRTKRLQCVDWYQNPVTPSTFSNQKDFIKESDAAARPVAMTKRESFLGDKWSRTGSSVSHST
uniref:Uncharacterized protein n=1 Tax=Lepeophtheirus salmonis TaxID=72036 RepID=A0A0K2UMY1_LEPSM